MDIAVAVSNSRASGSEINGDDEELLIMPLVSTASTQALINVFRLLVPTIQLRMGTRRWHWFRLQGGSGQFLR